jgi:hypothetical protein
MEVLIVSVVGMVAFGGLYETKPKARNTQDPKADK